MESNTEKVHGDGSFVKGSVRIVDYDSENKNLLVRGSSAFGASNFHLPDLVNTLEHDTYYKDTGIKLESTPMIVDFCLIGYGLNADPSIPTKDHKIVDAEMSWFTDNPPKLNGAAGPYPNYISNESATRNMVYWPVLALASGSNPNTTGGSWSTSPALSLTSANGGHDFDGLVPAIRNALTNNVDKLPSGFPASSIENAIIYVHCDSGVNRTGAAVAGYLMTYGSNIADIQAKLKGSAPYSMKDAQEASLKCAPSNNTPPGGVDLPVAQAYCNYINTQQVDGMLVSQCIIDDSLT